MRKCGKGAVRLPKILVLTDLRGLVDERVVLQPAGQQVRVPLLGGAHAEAFAQHTLVPDRPVPDSFPLSHL